MLQCGYRVGPDDRNQLPAGGVPTTLSGGIFVTCREVGMPTYEERKALRNAADHKAIVAAGLAGFMDCSDVFDALGF